MTKKERPKHLGRGLEALIGPINIQSIASSVDIPMQNEPQEADLAADKPFAQSMRRISLSSIEPNPYQPRTTWNETELAELADSIRANGVIQPIVVRKAGDGYQLIAGERRLRASELAGLKDIPAVVREATDEQLLELALVENIHRSNLNPIERARAYQRYLSTFSLSQTEAAERLGENRSVVANYLRLLDLPQEVRQMLIDEQLSMGHARALLALPTDELRRKLANRAMAGRLSVREVERLVQNYLAEADKPSARLRAGKPAHIMDLENRLAQQLGTRVVIQTKRGGQRGKIVIEFSSLEEFDRITDGMGMAEESIGV